MSPRPVIALKSVSDRATAHRAVLLVLLRVSDRQMRSADRSLKGDPIHDEEPRQAIINNPGTSPGRVYEIRTADESLSDLLASMQ